jgi:DNA-binding response OmpR family regulator
MVAEVLNTDRDIIKTVHGRGYVFTVEASAASIPPDPEAWPASAPVPPQPLPLLPTGLSGRSSPRRQWASGSPTGEPDDEAGPVVVVIDDDPDIRDALHGLMRAVGLLVGHSVGKSSRSQRPDAPGCLVLDVRLPGMSGLEFQRELGKSDIHLPIIFLTAYADIAMSVCAMKSGAIEFLTKPFREQELLDAIQLAIVQDRARRDAEQTVAKPASLLGQADAA